MSSVVSKDGTRIAYDQSGAGPAIILVLGAFNDRSTGAPLARALEAKFTVLNYDRRGRGASEDGDFTTYAVEREIEDLQALITAAGESAYVFGYSSGAILALRAAAHGLAMPKLVFYEPPPTGARAGEIAQRLRELIAANERGAAVELFQTDAVGIPPEIVARLRHAPFRPALEQIAQTLIYDSTLLQALPDGLAASVRVPTLILDGENSPEVMRRAAQTLAHALPAGELQTLPEQGHDIDPAVVAPVMTQFLLGS